MSNDNPSSQDTNVRSSQNVRGISQNVIVGDSQVQIVRQRLADTSTLADRLEVEFPKRKSTFYSVTESEINIYAQLGWISTFSLTLFGTFAGLALGCIVALLQDNLPAAATSTLNAIGWVTGVVSTIFSILAIVMMVVQFRSKKSWEAIE